MKTQLCLRATLWLLVLLAGGCAGAPGEYPAGPRDDRPDTTAAGQAVPPAATRLSPALPTLQPAGGGTLPQPQAALAKLLRYGSVTRKDAYRGGADFSPQLPQQHTLAAGPELSWCDFTPALDAQASPLAQCAYAGYSFVLPLYDGGPASLRLDWLAGADGAGTFFALANFAQDRWDWFAAPLEGSCSLPLLSPYLGPGDELLLLLARQSVGANANAASLGSLQLGMHFLPEAVPELTRISAPGVLPELWHLSGAASLAGGDLDDQIVLYEWDFEGDGFFDASGSEAGIEHSYPAGIYEPTLRVTDSQGQQASFSMHMVVIGHPPTAALEVPAGIFDCDEPVTISAAASTDPDNDIVLYEWDLNDDGDFETSTGGSDHYTGTFTFSTDNIAVRVTDSVGQSDEAVHSSLLNIDPLPDADFDWEPFEPQQGEAFQLDASASSDLYGDVVEYEWDMDGDGVFELFGGGDPLLEYSFDSVGFRIIALRVHDDDGHTATSYRYVEPSAPAGVVVLDQGNRIHHTSLASISGNPAIAFSQGESFASTKLFYVRAEDASGSQWGQPLAIDEVNVAQQPQLLEIDGRPAVGYTGGSDYWFVRAEDAQGLLWPQPLQLDDDQDPNSFVVEGSLALLGDLPMACFQIAGDMLRFRLAADSAGLAWGPVQSDGLDKYGVHDIGLSLCAVAGRPAFTCLHNNKVYYTRALDDAGVQWPLPQTVAFQNSYVNNGSRGYLGTCLRVVDGKPAVAFSSLSFPNSQLACARSLDSLGTDWSLRFQSGLDHDGWNPCLELVAGKPVMAGNQNYFGSLFLYDCSDSAGTLWGERQTLDSTGDTGNGLSLSDIGGAAALSYHELYDIGLGEYASRLKYLRLEP